MTPEKIGSIRTLARAGSRLQPFAISLFQAASVRSLDQEGSL